MTARVLVLVLSTLSACGTPRILRPPHGRCADGLPVRVLQDPACPPEGICGYTCAPNRWRDDGKD